jgi:hypothetical protein
MANRRHAYDMYHIRGLGPAPVSFSFEIHELPQICVTNVLACITRAPALGAGRHGVTWLATSQVNQDTEIHNDHLDPLDSAIGVMKEVCCVFTSPTKPQRFWSTMEVLVNS